MLPLAPNPLQKSLILLRKAYRLMQNKDWFNAQPQDIGDGLIAGVARHFEFAYKLSVKMLKRQLEKMKRFLESDLSWRIDAVDWATTNRSPRTIIRQHDMCFSKKNHSPLYRTETRFNPGFSWLFLAFPRSECQTVANYSIDRKKRNGTQNCKNSEKQHRTFRSQLSTGSGKI